jgi:hypothetical protein
MSFKAVVHLLLRGFSILLVGAQLWDLSVTQTGRAEKCADRLKRSVLLVLRTMAL